VHVGGSGDQENRRRACQKAHERRCVWASSVKLEGIQLIRVLPSPHKINWSNGHLNLQANFWFTDFRINQTRARTKTHNFEGTKRNLSRLRKITGSVELTHLSRVIVREAFINTVSTRLGSFYAPSLSIRVRLFWILTTHTPLSPFANVFPLPPFHFPLDHRVQFRFHMTFASTVRSHNHFSTKAAVKLCSRCTSGIPLPNDPSLPLASNDWQWFLQEFLRECTFWWFQILNDLPRVKALEHERLCLSW
jgi:hypothetical protein